MLEYTKTILEKMSFDKDLFNKELKKANRFLNEKEMNQLKIWVEKKYASLADLN